MKGIAMSMGMIAAATASLLLLSGTPAAAAGASGEAVQKARTLLDAVCLPTVRQGRPGDALALPEDYRTLASAASAAFLGGEEGSAYGTERAEDPVVAVWNDGRCAVYLRRLDDPAGQVGGFADWATALGLALLGEPQQMTSPGGSQAVIRRYGAPTGMEVVISHHSKDGRTGGGSISVLPVATPS
ncbi:MAG: hypothetical protein RLY86_3448 [Pseudomonadota bacterium]|jgi:hypothetical protein